LAVRFFLHHVNYKVKGRREIKACIGKILADHNKEVGSINVVLTGDSDLLKINKKFLKRKDYTDIITFDFSEREKISGDLFISIQRIEDNAILFKVSNDNELFRVIIHGILHLVGYNDKEEQEIKKMREMENKYLK
jgi:probable rRNA maturation factor